jgi:hypothetical protein
MTRGYGARANALTRVFTHFNKKQKSVTHPPSLMCNLSSRLYKTIPDGGFTKIFCAAPRGDCRLAASARDGAERKAGGDPHEPNPP